MDCIVVKSKELWFQCCFNKRIWGLGEGRSMASSLWQWSLSVVLVEFFYWLLLSGLNSEHTIPDFSIFDVFDQSPNCPESTFSSSSASICKYILFLAILSTKTVCQESKHGFQTNQSWVLFIANLNSLSFSVSSSWKQNTLFYLPSVSCHIIWLWKSLGHFGSLWESSAVDCCCSLNLDILLRIFQMSVRALT